MTRSVVPVSRVNCGVPVTLTASLKVTWMRINEPAPYEPSWAVDETLITVLANLIPYKGHAEVVATAPAVVAAHREARFVFVGRDDGIGPSLARQAEEAGVGNRITLAGPRRDIPDVLAASDILLSASHEEGFSNVILEGMEAGLPVVATRVGGNPEAVADGVTGVIVAPRDPADMARGLLEVLSRPDKGRVLGAAGRERVSREFTYGAMIAGMREFYREAISLAH